MSLLTSRRLSSYWPEPRLERLARLKSLAEAFDLVVLAVVVAFVFWQLHPSLIFSDSLLTGGDYGGHVDVPHFWRHYLLPKMQITGWSPDWYEGWPFLTFYFPFPAVLVGLLSFLIPYSVAFKLVIAVSISALPLCAYVMARAFREPSPVPGLAALATGAYLFNSAYTIYGGNIFSTMAGEYSFEVGFCLALLYLACLARFLRTGKYKVLCAILLFLVVLSHVLALLFALMGSLVVCVFSLTAQIWRRQLARLLLIGLAAAALAGFWLVPFLAYHSYMSDMGYLKVTDYYHELFESAAGPQIALLVALAGLWFSNVVGRRAPIAVSLLGVCGAVGLLAPKSIWWAVLGTVGVLLLIDSFGSLLSLLALVTGVAALAGFVFLPSGGLVLNGRAEPFFFFSVYLAAAIGFSRAVIAFTSLLSRRKAVKLFVLQGLSGVLRYVPAVGVLGVVWLSVLYPVPQGGVLGTLASPLPRNYATAWAAFNFKGYQNQPGYFSFESLMSLMQKLSKRYGCGTAMWEYNASYQQMGTTMALMLLPYFTGDCVQSEEGLFFESSASTPYHFVDQAELSAAPDYAMRNLPYNLGGPDLYLGIRHMQMLGVKYFIAVTSTIKKLASFYKDLVPIGSTPPPPKNAAPLTFEVYLVKGSSLIEPLASEPVVYDRYPPSPYPNIDPYTEQALKWWVTPWDLSVQVVDGGRKDWPHIDSLNELSRFIRQYHEDDSVYDIKVSTESVSFHVSRIGVPVLVKISYFPRWQASGAEGPYRAFPNLMVVVPTSHHVVLTYAPTAVDWAGKGLSVVGLLLLVFLALLKSSWRSVFAGPPDGF